jgi:hypothetical protein
MRRENTPSPSLSKEEEAVNEMTLKKVFYPCPYLYLYLSNPYLCPSPSPGLCSSRGLYAKPEKRGDKAEAIDVVEVDLAT